MANHKSAEKRIRQTEKRRLRNRVQRGKLRSSIKAVRTALDTGNVDEAGTLLKTAIASIDSTASKGVLHKNAASRKISRLTLAYNKAVAAK